MVIGEEIQPPRFAAQLRYQRFLPFAADSAKLNAAPVNNTYARGWVFLNISDGNSHDFIRYQTRYLREYSQNPSSPRCSFLPVYLGKPRNWNSTAAPSR